MDEEPELFDFIRDKNQLFEEISSEVRVPKVNKNRILCHLEVGEKGSKVDVCDHFLSEPNF